MKSLRLGISLLLFVAFISTPSYILSTCCSNPSPVGGIYAPSWYTFTRTHGVNITGDLSVPGAKTVTVTQCPTGINGTDTGHYIYISGGTGTAEPVLITGGSCTSGLATGTLTFTTSNTHTGSWTLTSAAFGLPEALVDVSSKGGGTIIIPPGTFTAHATIRMAGSGITLKGSGIYGTTIQRTEDYGDTFNIVCNGCYISDLKSQHVVNYITGNPGSISNPIPLNPNSAHFRVTNSNTITLQRVRTENLGFGIVASTCNPIVVRDSQFYGIWDRQVGGPQMTIASIQVNTETYGEFDNNLFVGEGNTNPAPGKHNVGPKYHMWFMGCEDCNVHDGSIGGANYSNLLFTPAAANGVLMNVRVHDIKFDGAYDSDIRITGDGTASASDLQFHGIHFNGEGQTDNAFLVDDFGSGSHSATAWTLQSYDVQAYLSTPIKILSGMGWEILGGTLRSYNYLNGYSTQATASAIYIGGRANYGMIANNQPGGDQVYNTYGAGFNYCKYGVSIGDITGAQAAVHYFNNDPPFYSAVGQYISPTFGSALRAYPNRMVNVGVESSVTGSVTVACLNDAATANIPCEFRGTSYWLGLGPTSTSTVNYIASETGSDNAIAGTLANITLASGLRVSVLLAHTLQAGANTFAYNGGAALAIKSSRNTSNNIATAYAVGGTITLQYDGTQWQDVSQ